MTISATVDPFESRTQFFGIFARNRRARSLAGAVKNASFSES